MKHLILAALAALALSACGRIDTSGTITVTHQVNAKALEPYFRALCASQNPSFNSAQIDACTKAYVGGLLSGLNQ